ncbi:hypothetical protein HELRODRAFT_169356 [Helobdella robusta]|uniref:Uncharacterized protein n=1 Tax=Helobdella robusta TaxID=6412 RepID=T1F1U0_HELRO|nr:hypothetical protein HELRODRAFT_169356 [Helobdella robusta]ESO08499.1 hypothetical protein HELRODRAFT_169356 [Helobdella robusta]
MDGSALYSCCSQAGSLQQLLSNKLTGHSIACYRDDPIVVQTKLQQLVNLSLECLANKDMLSLVDASSSGGTASVWVEVTSSSSSVAGGGGAGNSLNSANGTTASAINE